VGRYTYLQQKGEKEKMMSDLFSDDLQLTEDEEQEVKDAVSYDLSTMNGALDKYHLTFDFVAKKLAAAFNNPTLENAEERHRLEMILKIRGAYKTEDQEEETQYKWGSN